MVEIRKPLWEVTRSLSAVCMGREPADLLITGGRLVNVHTRSREATQAWNAHEWDVN